MIAIGARRWIELATLVLVLTPSAAAARQAPVYLDPLLRMLDRPGTAAAAAELLRAEGGGAEVPAGRLRLGGAVVSGTPAEPRLGVLVQLRDPTGLDALRAAGAEIGAAVGDIVTARVPVGSLGGLGGAPGLAIVQAARLLRAVNDSSTRAINAHLVRQVSNGEWTGFAGQNAITGIYDSGVDYTHHDFRRSDGGTRIVGLWDQTQSGAPPPGRSYGVYCAPASLDAGACPQRDTFGHGTHVAGTAAGDGSGGLGSDFRYAGVAPLADLLVVKGGNESFAENLIVDGLEWIFDEAERLGRPAVANLSLGGQFGPHDGTRLFELAIDQLSGPGRIVVASAGNDGSNRNTLPPLDPEFVHADGLPSAGPADYVVAVPVYGAAAGACNDAVLVDLWYESQDRVSVTVVRPDGSSATAAFGQSVQDNAPAGQIAIENAPNGQPYPQNGDFEAVIRFSDCDGSGPPATGNWIVRVVPTASASGRPYHLWIADADLGGSPAFGVQGFNNRVVIGSPGNARRAVTVGAFVSRLCFPSRTGQTLCAASPEQIGDIASFSAAGPTRDDRLKPEITAPGRLVVSSLSSATQVQSQLVTPDGAHWVLQGTSMSAPHVTGAIAIMLQTTPQLTPEAVKDVLAQSAREDAFTRVSHTGEPPGVPNNQWGWGKLDVLAALDVLGSFNVVATVTVAAEALPAGVSSSRRGTRLPLLALEFSAEGTGAARIDALGFEATGNDPAARVVLILDADGDGAVDPGEPEVGAAAVSLAPADTVTVVVPAQLVIEPGESVQVLAALELSGQVPNDAAFQLRYLPSATAASAAAGGGIVVLEQESAIVASALARTTVVPAGDIASVSENPVRSERVIINFRERPDVAALYTAAGRRVVDLLDRGDGLRIEWDLTNDEGARVAPGVYLLVVAGAGGELRLKLIVLTPGGAAGA